MFEGLFQPLHLLILLISAAMVFGMPFLAGYLLGRYVEMKKLRRP
jgi:membrane protein DedA with SNARE-associated domain